ncbi:MAG: hypothetical protein VX320_00295 [Candidatus Thermoplasmatota archaeon]|nr:hypothetical protein [Candidatus Thermoplasmatota archaeon]
MSKPPSDGDERPRLDAATLPEEVQRLWETMLRLDPSWDIREWLSERAAEEMRLVGANLAREKIRFEQRISRIDALAARINREQEREEQGPRQYNLFDDFSGETPAIKDSNCEEDEDWNPHPATAHINYLSDDVGDDPLLAVCAQSILLSVEESAEKNALPVTLEEIGMALSPRGIDTEELVEALEWLLEKGKLIEVDENEFVPGENI